MTLPIRVSTREEAEGHFLKAGQKYLSGFLDLDRIEHWAKMTAEEGIKRGEIVVGTVTTPLYGVVAQAIDALSDDRLTEVPGARLAWKTLWQLHHCVGSEQTDNPKWAATVIYSAACGIIRLSSDPEREAAIALLKVRLGL